MTLYLKMILLKGLISTNVTVLLVITTLFISVSESLPTTAYIKMIDVWLIFNLLKPFIDIIVQTYIESLREADTKVLGIKIYDLIPYGIFYIIDCNSIQDDVEPLEKQAWVDEEMADNDQKLRSKVRFK